MRGTRTLTFGLLATVLAMVGCGSAKNSGGTTRATTAVSRHQMQELILAADTICGRVNARVGAVEFDNGKEIAHVAPSLASLERTELTELKRLQAPPSLAADWRQILDGVQSLAEDTATYARAASHHNLQSAEAALTVGAKIREQAAAVAKRDGFNDCAHVG